MAKMECENEVMVLKCCYKTQKIDKTQNMAFHHYNDFKYANLKKKSVQFQKNLEKKLTTIFIDTRSLKKVSRMVDSFPSIKF